MKKGKLDDSINIEENIFKPTTKVVEVDLRVLRSLRCTAKLLPLDGKYYGTKIEINFANGDKTEFDIWYSGSYIPSERYLEKYGYTKQQYENNELVDNGWGNKSPIREMDLVCDSHFESEETYLLAKFIVDAINAA